MEDYKKRMIEEYQYVKDKQSKLYDLLVKYDSGTLGHELGCPDTGCIPDVRQLWLDGKDRFAVPWLISHEKHADAADDNTPATDTV